MTRKVTGTPLYQRVYASLLAGAVGDMMGFAVEGHHYQTIRRRWGVIDRPMVRPDGDRLTPPVSQPVYTDDTVMRHMVCAAIVASGGAPTPTDIARVWREHIRDFQDWRWWLNTRVVGAKVHWSPWVEPRDLGRDSVACDDAAMIIAPVGLLCAADPEKAALLALDLASVWQRGYSRECAAGMAAAHAEALSPTATPATVVKAACHYAPTLAPYVERAVALAEKTGDAEAFTEAYYRQYVPGPNEDYWSGHGPADWPGPWCFNADPLEVCSVGVAFFVLGGGDLGRTISGAASFGRDCDTIAGIAASLAGALYGGDTLPADWTAAMQTGCPEPDIGTLAAQVTELLLGQLERTRGRVAGVLGLAEPTTSQGGRS